MNFKNLKKQTKIKTKQTRERNEKCIPVKGSTPAMVVPTLADPGT